MREIEILFNSIILGGCCGLAVCFCIEFFTNHKKRVARYLSILSFIVMIVIFYALALHMAIHNIGGKKLTDKTELNY